MTSQLRLMCLCRVGFSLSHPPYSPKQQQQLLCRISSVLTPARPGESYCYTQEPITSQGQREEDRESGSSENNGGKSRLAPRERQERSHLVQSEREKRNYTSLSCPGVFSNVTFSLCFLRLRVLSFPCVMWKLLPPLSCNLLCYIIVKGNGH